jgi:hypothetical protein
MLLLRKGDYLAFPVEDDEARARRTLIDGANVA